MTLPNYLIDAFDNIPTNQPVNVLLRHSIRFPIGSDAEVYTAQLTPEGEDLASTFGAWINQNYKIGKILTSPINRCVETGKHLAKGAGNGKVIIADPVLSHPNENGEYDLLGDYLASGEWPERIKQIADKMFPEDQSVEMNFFVTHDTVLALMAAYWLRIDIRATEDWPQFLEPMFFWKANKKRVIYFRGNKFIVE
jgi:broad specificity phosphatase PhoE